MPKILPGDTSTWDVPDIIKPKPAPKPRARRRTPTSTAKPAPVVRPRRRVTPPDPAEAAATHPESQYIPAEVAFAAAQTSAHRDLDRNISYLARETSLPIEYFFGERTTLARGGTGYIAPNGMLVSADDARHIVRRISHDPQALKSLLRNIVDSYNAENPSISLVPPKRGRVRRSIRPNVTVSEVSDIMRIIDESLGPEWTANVSFTAMVGTAIQVAGRLRSRQQLDMFAQNLSLLRDQTAGHWRLSVAQAEQGAVSGRQFESVQELFGVTDPAVQQVFDEAQSAIPRRRYGDRLYEWQWRADRWVEVTDTAVDIAWSGAEISIYPPSEWDAIPIDELTITAAGFDPALHTLDPGRIEDYYIQSRQIAHEIEMQDIAAEQMADWVGSALHVISVPFQLSQGGALKATDWLSRPFAWGAAYVSSGFDLDETRTWVSAYDREMQLRAADIIEGRETLGTLSARNVFGEDASPWLTIPWTFGADLVYASMGDPLVAISKFGHIRGGLFRAEGYHPGSTMLTRGLRRIQTDSVIAEWLDKTVRLDLPDRTQALVARFGSRGEAIARRLDQVSRALDERIGLPIFGAYGSDGAKYRAMLDYQLARPRRYLGGKTVSQFLVSEALEGRDVYARVNEKLRGLYHREAFDAQTIHTVETIVSIAKQAGNVPEEQLILLVDDLLLASMGAKPFDAAKLADILQYEAGTAQLRGFNVRRGFTGEQYLRPGFQPQIIQRELETMEAVVPNVIGDVRYATARDLALARNPGARQLVKVEVDALRDFDLSYTRLALDEIDATFGGFRPRQFEFPRKRGFAFARGRSLTRNGWIGNEYVGRGLRAFLTGRIPEAVTRFEEGKFVEDVSRRIVRSRVLSDVRREELLKEARLISQTTNPTRETSMVAFLERLQRELFDGIATEYGLSTNREFIWERLKKEIRPNQTAHASEAYGVTVEHLDDGSVRLTKERADILESQLLNGWYTADPLAMRRAVREAVGLHRSTEAVLAHIAGARFAEPMPISLPELSSSAERTIFHEQLLETARRLKWDERRANFAVTLFDQMAINALVQRPDVFQTVDDFFRVLGTNYKRRTPVSLDGLFRRVAEFPRLTKSGDIHATDLAFLVGQMDAFADTPLWYASSREGILRSFGGHRVNLVSGGKVIETVDLDDLITRILAVTSGGQQPKPNMTIALNVLDKYLEDPEHIFTRADKIMGRNDPEVLNRIFHEGYVPDTAKFGAFYRALRGDLDEVVIDRRMLGIFGFIERKWDVKKGTFEWINRSTAAERAWIAEQIRTLAAANGIAPAVAQERLWVAFNGAFEELARRTRNAELKELYLALAKTNDSENFGTLLEGHHATRVASVLDTFFGSPARALERTVTDVIDVPARDLIGLLEFPNRAVVQSDGSMVGRTADEIASLRESLRTRGYDRTQSFIELEVNLNTGVGIVREGHHRIGLMAELDMDVPVHIKYLDENPWRTPGHRIDEVRGRAPSALRALSEIGETGRPVDVVVPDSILRRILTGEGVRQETTLFRRAGERVVGAFVRDDTGIGGVMNFFEGADPRTLVHEAGHLLRSMLPEDDLDMLSAHYGLRFDDNFERVVNPEKVRAAEERFAQDVEAYFEGALAPTELEGAFARIRAWLERLWAQIRGKQLPTGSTIDPNIEAILDRWFFREGLGKAEGRLASLAEADLEPNVKALWAKRGAEWLSRGYLHLWKPLQVMRPGYILRVPSLDEQIRFLVDAGLSARVHSQGFVGSLADRLGRVDRETTYIPTRAGHSVPVERVVPGALLDDRYANSVSASEIYLTMSEQADAVIKGAGKQYWDSVAPDNARYEPAWDTAVNGHLSTSVPGRIALKGVVDGLRPDDIAKQLVRWANDDPEGVRIIQRIAPEDIDGWAQTLAELAYGYTMGQPRIALLAMRRQAAPGLLDDVLGQLRDAGRAHLNAIEGTANRALRTLEPGEIDRTVTRLRAYLKASLERSGGEFGGGSFDPVTGKFLEDGGQFAVGIREGTVVARDVAVLEDPKALRGAIEEFLEKERAGLETIDGSILGFWISEGKLHIDLTVKVPDQEVAQGIALLKTQEGIWQFRGRDVDGYIPTVSKPTVHGLLLEHQTGAGVSPIDPIVDAIGKRILQYPTNRLSRQPFFKTWYDRMLELQLDLFKESGFVPSNAAEAERMIAGFQANARRFALDRVNRVMFNFKDQSRLSELLHFVVPFMQPWQEAFSVYGHLLRKNPALAAWAHRTFLEAARVGSIERDPDTGEWAMPMTNFLGVGPAMSILSHWPGMRLVSSLSSFNLFFNNAFPITNPLGGSINLPVPSLSPPVTWFLQQLKKNDESRLATWLYQFGGIGVRELLPFPTWMHNAITSVVPSWNEDAYAAYTEEFLRMSQMPGFGIEFKNADERIEWAKNQAKTLFRYKTFISLFFNSAPRIEFPTKPAADYARAMIKKYKDEPDGFDMAREAFLERFPGMWLTWQAKTIWEREDPGLPGAFDTPPIPATEKANAILNSPGFKEFAERFPAMAWAVLPQEAYENGDYSPDLFQKQLAVADRRYLSPEEFYAAGEAAAGWDGYWHLREWWEAKQEWLKFGNVSETNPEWTYWQDQYKTELDELRRLYPAWNDEYGTTEEQVLDDRVLRYARALAKDEVFSDFPMGKGLIEYLELRDELKREMAAMRISSIDSAGAIDAGISGRYEAGVNDIIARYPEFERAYLLFFEGRDLRAVRSDVAKQLDAMSEAEREVYFAWQRGFNDVQDQIDLAPDDLAKAPLYLEESAMIAENPEAVKLWYENLDYTSRHEYDLRVQMKSFLFLNAFEREYILKIPTDDTTEGLWRRINETRAEISTRGKLDDSFSTSAAYDALNVWIRQQAQANPVFASQLSAANTWGYAFFQRNEYVMQAGDAGEFWRALRATVANYQAAVEAAGLHGVGSTEASYNGVRQQLIEYVQTLKARSPAFAAQWDQLELVSSADLINTFMPEIWFRLGG